MSVLVHGEEKRESVVRELHGVGLEHREARAVRHDDVVGAPCAGTLGVADRDRVREGRVGVAVAVRRPHAAAARPRSRHGRRRRVAVVVWEVVPVRLGCALRSRPRALGAAAVRRAAALEGVAAAARAGDAAVVDLEPAVRARLRLAPRAAAARRRRAAARRRGPRGSAGRTRRARGRRVADAPARSWPYIRDSTQVAGRTKCSTWRLLDGAAMRFSEASRRRRQRTRETHGPLFGAPNVNDRAGPFTGHRVLVRLSHDSGGFFRRYPWGLLAR